MDEEFRPGYYKDELGNWQKDRRKSPERRRRDLEYLHRDRRTIYRRKTDQEILDQDQRQQIAEALEDFAAEHEHRTP